MNIYRKIRKKGKENYSKKGKAVLLMKTVREGILAEKVLLKNGFIARKVVPPPEFRKGCEISVEIDLVNKNEILTLLSEYDIESQGLVEL